jgi:thiamine-phosphate pyrophosphorylase
MIDMRDNSYKQRKMQIFSSAGLYLVTSTELSNLPTLEVLERFLRAGGKLFQLREKTFSEEMLYETGLETRKLADKYGAVFIMNDQVDIALAVGADGVHLGQEDMNVDEARKILGDGAIIGVSTHNIEEAVKAQADGADYINIGPVFSTQTKPHASVLGTDGLEYILPHVKIPFTFMGGIKEDNMSSLLKYKPAAVAMVTEVTKAKDIETKVRNIVVLSSSQ